ncbi:TonB-dependent copper receptor [Ferrimonas pelagia]|uniref:TonB-dependent copper receptor n=1 Tax=Ferrimonas pelagia TaxID=1177826 RepID=A0ABP9FEN9_9GAMM
MSKKINETGRLVGLTPLALAVLTALAPTAWAQSAPADGDNERPIEVMVITTEHMELPGMIVTDPKQPRQPLPAYDGADFLKTIPGFNVNRKGGAGGDPSFRGMAGSRLGISAGGMMLHTACGGRMDPPTAYLYPEAYDRVTVIKGPQSVRYGGGNSAGMILFDKDHHQLSESGASGRISLTGASFDRHDEIVEVKVGAEQHYLDVTASNANGGHYQDGDGNKVQSSYRRNNFRGALGWTPDQDTVVELSYGLSDGEAEYADRANKARKIANENVSLLMKRRYRHDWIRNVEAQAFYSEVDHIMDQFDQGVNSGTNPVVDNYGGRLLVELTTQRHWGAAVGTDYNASRHRSRTIDPSQDNGLDDLLSKPLSSNSEFTDLGLFAEVDLYLPQGILYTGVRWDHWQADLHVAQGGSRSEELFSGFGRYELNTGGDQYYAGIGYVERAPDHWEIWKADATQSGAKAFDLAPERTTQLDLGWIHQRERYSLSASLFYSDVRDYILVESKVPVADSMLTVSRNVDATLYGGEISAVLLLSDYWSLTNTLAYTHGDNDSDNLALGQISPLEANFSLNYDSEQWAFGALWRVVAAQDRVALNQGNIAGQDFSESAGFGVLSLYGGWMPNETVMLTLGVDNLLDKAYSEHVSKSGAGNDIPGSEPLFKVTEPGRTAWVKLNYRF